MFDPSLKSEKFSMMNQKP